MSLFKNIIGRGVFNGSTTTTTGSVVVTQIRNATKKVSGSKTNKNDSAGRRLGPKAHEGHFVKPGQIIMRQRGTKIHPGENVSIGIDHTIYAVEPGYVRFYYDPFHPLRKYVGVSLKEELKLPTPHFSPRVRRFGYVEISGEKAEQEEAHMSRSEFLAQPQIEAAKALEEAKKLETIGKYQQALSKTFGINQDLELLADRYLSISQFLQNGESLEEAKTQATFNFVYDTKLAVKRGELTEEAGESLKNQYISLVSDLDLKVEVDAQGNLCKYTSPEERSKLQKQTLETLQKDFNKVLSKDDRSVITNLIETPGIFTKSEQTTLKTRYLPEILSVYVPGSVIPDIDPETADKNIVVQKIFDEASRSTKVVGRPINVFASKAT